MTIRAAQPLGACSGTLGTASKLGKIRGPQMGSIQRPLTLGRKTMEVEILKEALAKAQAKKPSLQLASPPKDAFR